MSYRVFPREFLEGGNFFRKSGKTAWKRKNFHFRQKPSAKWKNLRVFSLWRGVDLRDFSLWRGVDFQNFARRGGPPPPLPPSTENPGMSRIKKVEDKEFQLKYSVMMFEFILIVIYFTLVSYITFLIYKIKHIVNGLTLIVY